MNDLIRELFCRSRDLFRRRRLEAELAEELRAHVEMQEAVSRAAGMPPTEASCAGMR